ncbi:variable surface lipoprotein, partial [Xanthomonas citri pv. citri]|nr:variable surface lipoprotein [Xanthomonas citri pv. citri]
MKKISKKLLSSLSLLTIPSVAVISAKCGNDVETTERLNQQKDLKENK